MIVSMTGFASARGQGLGCNWTWEIRSVNGKGLDLRLRLPDWIEGLEPLVRAETARRIQRGNVSLTLRVNRDAGAEPLRVNRGVLAAVLAGMEEVTRAAAERGLEIGPVSGSSGR